MSFDMRGKKIGQTGNRQNWKPSGAIVYVHSHCSDSAQTQERWQDLRESGGTTIEVGVRKPNIKIFKAACEQACVLLKEAMFVGDTIQNDIVGANRAGMTSVFINRKSDVLIPKIADGRPDYSVSNLYDVLSCLEHKHH